MLAVQANLVSKALSPYSGSSLLELGGGHGQLLDTYQALSIDATLHGSAPSCFTRLRDEGFERPTVVSPLDQLPFADRSFDVVVAIRLVSHLVQWQTVVTEMCRVAREAVLIDYPSRHSLNAIAPMLFSMKKRFEGNTRAFALFNKREISQPFLASGFGCISEAKQFCLPMALHRMLGSSPVAGWLEDFSGHIGLTRKFGSPVILLATRSGT